MSFEFFKRIAVGQDALVSDLIVISLSQYFIRPANQRDALWMAHMLDIATDLDRTNFSAWLFAENMMAFRDEERRASIRILQKGRRLFPHIWQFGLWLALRYIELEDYDSALVAAQETAAIPGAPPVVQRLPVFIQLRKGAYDLAIGYLAVLLERATDEQERDFIRKRIQWIEDARVIETAAKKYFEVFGTYPSYPGELVRAGFLSEVPGEPFGYEYRINSKGRVYSEVPGPK